MSSEPSVDDSSPALAHAKRIGNDVEDLVLDAVEALAPADDSQAHHDAVTVAVLTPSAADDLQFGSIEVVEPDTEVEVKAAKVRTDATDTPRGRWFFKGCEDGQHHELVQSDAMYLLAVYDEHDNGERELLAMLLIPASIIDEVLRGRWYESGRREGLVSKLTWSALIDPSDLDANGGDEA